MFRLVFSSDIHGNEIQYRKLVDYAISISADAVVIGGDIAPKDASRAEFIQSQRKFLENKLPKLLMPLRQELPDSRIFLIMGNDDCAANLDVLENQADRLHKIIHKKRVKLSEEFDIVGYPYVPITPFGIKDWEKFDFSNPPQGIQQEYGLSVSENLRDERSEVEYANRKKTNYRLDGIKSTSEGWKDFLFTPEMEKMDSIQKDLEEEVFTKKPNKTVYVIHTPPNRTNLDQTNYGAYVGSLALRAFIEKHQPYLTLHGHIHETVDVSGDFRQKIGNTLCLCSGNHNVGEKLALLDFDLYNLKDVKRVII